MLSAQNRSEFLATPQLVRFDFTKGKDDFEPTLLVKADALVLKYLVTGASFRLVFARIRDGRLFYGLMIFDDPGVPAILWSILERREEQNALLGLAEGKTCQIFLFNELAINVAWVAIPLKLETSRLGSLAASALVGAADHANLGAVIDQILAQAITPDAADPEYLVSETYEVPEWQAVRNTLITKEASASGIDIFDLDEGRQQEKLVTWQTDGLFPTVRIDQPQIENGSNRRELTDALLSYPEGSFLFESKALSLLDRPKLPDRPKLIKNILGHIDKAVKQLKGAVRKIKSGADIMDHSGKIWMIERTQPIHCIILIPDLRLLPDEFGGQIMLDFMEATGGFLHILDPSELLRIIQVTEELVRRSESQTITPMVAFDSRLIERAKACIEAGYLNMEIVTHFVEK